MLPEGTIHFSPQESKSPLKCLGWLEPWDSLVLGTPAGGQVGVGRRGRVGWVRRAPWSWACLEPRLLCGVPCSQHTDWWLGITLGPLIRGYFHSWGFPHDLNISPKLHQQISSCLGLGFQHMNLGWLGSFRDFPGGSEVKESTCNAGEIRDLP